jgi:hypothetical protein
MIWGRDGQIASSSDADLSLQSDMFDRATDQAFPAAEVFFLLAALPVPIR